MKPFVYFLMAALLCTVAIRADEITLTDGKTVFHNAKIISQDTGSVQIKHSRGIARVMIADLPPELRAQFKYDPKAATRAEGQAQQAVDDYNAVAAARAAAEDAYRKALEEWNRSAVTLNGKILSVSGNGLLLKGSGLGIGETDVVFVKNAGKGFVDDEYVSVTGVPAGTYQYSSAGNAGRTVPAYDAARPIKPENR